MGVTRSKRPAAVLAGLEERIYVHIVSGERAKGSLALALGVSVPTVSRGIERLRRTLESRGLELVSVRTRAGSRYEIRGHEAYVRRSWRGSRLRKLAGLARSWRPLRGRSEDEILYGSDR